jgi:hypothetical protein
MMNIKLTGFLANASAAHDPEGPPPTTATLNFFELVIGEAITTLKADNRITDANIVQIITLNERKKYEKMGRIYSA